MRTRLLLAALTMFPATASAQIDIGIRAGVSVSSLKIENEDTESLSGFVGGGFATFHLGDVFFLQPEILVSRKGATLIDADDVALTDVDFRFDYLEIPLLLGAGFPIRESTIRPRLYAGPTLNFALGCAATDHPQQDGQSVPASCPHRGVNVNAGSVDLGLVGGAALGASIEGVRLWLDARYQYGLVDVNEFPGPPGGLWGTSLQNRAWQFMFGLGIPIRR